MSETKETILIVLTIWFIISFISGVVSSMDERINNGRDGCVYQSYASFISFGYPIACELTRVRFNKEQPVEYVPKEVKKID